MEFYFARVPSAAAEDLGGNHRFPLQALPKLAALRDRFRTFSAHGLAGPYRT